MVNEVQRTNVYQFGQTGISGILELLKGFSQSDRSNYWMRDAD